MQHGTELLKKWVVTSLLDNIRSRLISFWTISMSWTVQKEPVRGNELDFASLVFIKDTEVILQRLTHLNII